MPVVHPETALIPYVRGELSGAERELIAAHLELCGLCRESAESFRALLSELSSRLEELPVPPARAYRAELMAKLEARQQRRRTWWRPDYWSRPLYGWAGVAAAAAAAGLALWLAVPGFRHAPGMPADDQIALVQQFDVGDVGLLRNYGVVQRLDMLENYDVIEHLDELRPASKPSDAMRS